MINPWRRRALAGLAAIAISAGAIVGMPAQSAVGVVVPRWVGTWGTALTAASLGNTASSLAGFSDQSIRMVVHASVGGDKVRIRLSNVFGTQAVTIGHATVGLSAAAGSADVVPGSVKELKFNSGSASAVMYKGSDLLSDPIDLTVAAQANLAVTLYLPTATGPTSWHWTAKASTYVFAGDHASDPSGAGFTAKQTSYHFLAGVDVQSRTAYGSVVVLGDSISDGAGATLDANSRWTDQLGARITGTWPDLLDPGVLNEGLSGNRVTGDGIEFNFPALGTSGLSRLDTDVFGQTDVRTVIVQLGINDIQLSGYASARVIDGLRQLVAQIRERNLRVLVCTLSPYEGYPSWSAAGETARSEVNGYIRSHAADFDGILDFDSVLRDPAAPTKVKAEFDFGDHIHPNDAGAAALAAAVPLWQL